MSGFQKLKMVYQKLSKMFVNFLGMLRLASVVGFWNFFSMMLSTIIFGHSSKARYIKVKGFSIPMMMFRQSEAAFEELITDDLANFKTRDDDVFVVAFVKSGHHWSYDFINMLLRGNLELDNVVKEAFFVDLMLPMARGMKPFDRMASPRTIYTHYFADHLPTEVFSKKRKIIRLIR